MGRSVILDATFSRAHARRQAFGPGKKFDAAPFTIECRPSGPLLLDRLRERAQAGGGIAGGHRGIFTRRNEAFEPIVDEERLPVVQTDRAVPLLLDELLAHPRLNIPVRLFGIEAEGGS